MSCVAGLDGLFQLKTCRGTVFLVLVAACEREESCKGGRLWVCCLQVLRRLTLVDAFVKHASRWIDGELVFKLLEELLVSIGKTGDLVNVLDGIVRSIGGNHARRTRAHTTELPIFRLPKNKDTTTQS